jgi:hypothetical protein
MGTDGYDSTTQVCFTLSSASTFSHSDTVTDSEVFYISLFDVLDDIREGREVRNLIDWWNRSLVFCSNLLSLTSQVYRKIFPHSSPESIPVPVEGSPLDRIRQMRAEEELERD